jgi:hypothetical protein
MTKRCSRCGVDKPLSAFNRSKRDGVQSQCKTCKAETQREYRRREPEARRERQRQWRARHVEREREKARARQKAHREKTAARDALRYAVKCGLLVRPDVCERCRGSFYYVEAHHEDYSKPLDVQWLCRSCHSNHHLELIRPEGVGGRAAAISASPHLEAVS